MNDREKDRPTPGCVPVDEMGTVLERDRDDARRRHVESCPRCRALARELTSFLEEPPLSAADAGVVASLEQSLQEEIIAPGRESRSWWRPAIAAAAALIAFVVAVPLLNRETEEGTVLRGATDDAASTFDGQPAASVRGAGGDRIIEFRWSAQVGAEAYRVEVYDAGLSSLATIEAGTSTTVSWPEPGAALPADTAPATWRVVGLRHGDAVLRSDFLPFPDAGADTVR